MSELSFILDQMCWSYSRIETYIRCPYCFYLNYILKKDSADGFFGQYGTFGHDILEKYFKNELLVFELENEFINNYTSKVTAYAPPNNHVDLAVSYFNQGKEYFSNFDGLDDEYEILGVESEYKYKIDKYDFTGTIDLELKHKDGWLEILDHKSKSGQHKSRMGKNDNINNYIQLVNKKYIPFDLAIQLYLYCVPFKEKHGEYPRYLNFNMFRINDWYQFEFNKDDFERSKKWVMDSINKIYNDSKWVKCEDATDFWCSFVCGQNKNCKYSDRYDGIV